MVLVIDDGNGQRHLILTPLEGHLASTQEISRNLRNLRDITFIRHLLYFVIIYKCDYHYHYISLYHIYYHYITSITVYCYYYDIGHRTELTWHWHRTHIWLITSITVYCYDIGHDIHWHTCAMTMPPHLRTEMTEMTEMTSADHWDRWDSIEHEKRELYPLRQWWTVMDSDG